MKSQPKLKENDGCYLCGSQKAIEEHHIDWHHENNEPENRSHLCHRCHMELHRSGYVSKQELDGIRDKIRAERTPGVAAVSGYTGGGWGEGISPWCPQTNSGVVVG